jgi:hypothetical protein
MTRVDFKDQGRVVEVVFALWSPATGTAKTSLNYDSGSAFPYERAKFNDAAKSKLINDCFADPIIYSGSLVPGSVGEALRRDMAQVVCQFLDGSWSKDGCVRADSTTPRAFITESLGSKLLFDAVERVASDGSRSDRSVSEALNQTGAIYMLANQLPLLRLAEAQTGIVTALGKSSELRLFRSSPPTGILKKTAEASPLQVVAFTDPNDPFSYRLTYESIGADSVQVRLFNVIVSNAKTYFGLAEDPYRAHLGYWANPQVSAYVLNGAPRGPL